MPTTSDGKKFDYTKLGMMKAKMHQQRLDKNKKSMGSPYSKAGIVAGASIPAFLGLMELTMPKAKAGGGVEKYKAQRLGMNFQTLKSNFAKEAAQWKLKKPSGGGGGGIYNVAQPLTNKGLLNKWKKLK